MDNRQTDLLAWCQQQLLANDLLMEPVSGDASFRRYFRVHSSDGQTDPKCWIAMDAPPEKEDSHSFVALARFWRERGINVPELIAVDLPRGFILLEDFGDHLLLSSLKPDCPDVVAGDRYYNKAISTLLDIQSLPADGEYDLPPYDRALLSRELELFRHWLLEKKLGMQLGDAEQAMLDEVFESLIRNALEQEQVPVHRDYHSRNLMIARDDQLGVLDFQDAVLGPVTYDLVSLLRDCYIAWPQQQLEGWMRGYFDQAKTKGLVKVDWNTFCCHFDRMGMQRHMKAAGIFARLALRDGKLGYLQDIPRTVHYILEACFDDPEFADFRAFLVARVLPALVDLDRSA